MKSINKIKVLQYDLLSVRLVCLFASITNFYFVVFFFRYEYDDHYFLTDPREFIYEFFPLQPEWQLLKTPISLQNFEELPFVRSLFFRYGLYFPDAHTKAVMYTDATGNDNLSIMYSGPQKSWLLLPCISNGSKGHDFCGPLYSCLH